MKKVRELLSYLLICSMILNTLIIALAIPKTVLAEDNNELNSSGSTTQGVIGVEGLLDILDLGNTESEAAHDFSGEYTESVVAAEGETARVALPLDPATYFGGDMTFKLAVDPAKQNYVTIKFWGSDASTYYTHIYVEGERLGYQNGGDIQAINKSESAVYENRFSYNTQLIPMRFTQGRTEVEITIKTAGAHWNYGMGSFARLYKEKVTGKSKGYYDAYSHITAALPTTVLESTSKDMIWTVREGTELDYTSSDAREWLKKQKETINTFISECLTIKKDKLMGSNLSTDVLKLANYLRRDMGEFTFEDNGIVYDYTPDILLDNELRDQVLDRLRLGLDQMVLYYLSEPSITIKQSAAHAEWGSYMKAAGEAVWVAYQLFEGQAKVSSSDAYLSVERPLITNPVTGNLYGNKDNLSEAEKKNTYIGMYGAMYLTQEECQKLGVSYTEGKYKSFDDWMNASQIIDWSDTTQVPTDKANPFAAGTAKVVLNVIEKVNGSYQFFDNGQYVNTDETGKLTYASTESDEFKGNNKTTRLAAWQDMFYVLFSYNRIHERGITNQTFYSAFGTFQTNLALLAMGSSIAENYSSGLRFLYNSCGVDYWLGNDVVDASVETSSGKYLAISNLSNFEKGYNAERSYVGEKEAPNGYQYKMVSPDGLTKEPSYVAGYGQASDYIVDVWKTTHDDKLMKMALKASNARAYMSYQDTAEGERAMRIEGVVESRGPIHPGYVTYQGRVEKGEGLLFSCFEVYFKKNEDKYTDPEWDLYKTYAKNAVGYAQHQLMDNYYLSQASSTVDAEYTAVGDYIYTANPENYKGILMPMAYNSSLTESEKALIEQENPGYLENRNLEVFTDIEDAIVAVRDNDNVFYIEFFYLSSYGMNGMAKIHSMTPFADTTATVVADVLYTPSGYWNTRPDFTVQNSVYDPDTQPVDGAIMALRGQILPIAASVNDGENFDDYNVTAVNTGSAFSGYGECYSMQYGKYFIVLNTTTNNEYEVTLPSGYTAATVRNIVTNEDITISSDSTVKVPESTTLVLDLEQNNIENNTPGASIFITGVGCNNAAAISWETAAGTDLYYEIYRADSVNGEYTAIGQTADEKINIYIDTTAEAGKTYYYKVRGYSGDENALVKGAMSVYVKVDIPSTTIGNDWASSDVNKISGLTPVLGETEDVVRFEGTPTTKESNVHFAKDKGEVINGKEVLPNYSFAYQNSIVATNPEVLLTSNGLSQGIAIDKGDSATITADIVNDYSTVSSDFTFSSKVASENPVGYSGIMVKELRNQKIAENARGIIFTVSNTGEYRISYRQYPDIVAWIDYVADGYDLKTNYNPDPITGTIETKSEDGTYYLKLVRDGDYYSAYVSADGLTYELVGEELWIPMAKTVAVGVASAKEAIFSDITLNDGYDDTNRPMTPMLRCKEYANTLELSWLTVTNGKTFDLYRTMEEDSTEYPVVTYQKGNTGNYDSELDVSCGWERITQEGYVDSKYVEENITTSKTIRYVLVARSADGYPSNFSNIVQLNGVGYADGTNGRLSLAPLWNLAEWNVNREGFVYLDSKSSTIRLYSQTMDKTDSNAGAFLYQEVDATQDFTFISRIDNNGEGLYKIPLWGSRGIMVRNDILSSSAYVGAVSKRLDRTGAWVREKDNGSIIKGIYDIDGPVGLEYKNDADLWKKIVKTGNNYQVFYAPVIGNEKSYNDITGWKSLGYYSGTEFIDTFQMTSTQNTLYLGTYMQSYDNLSYLDTLYAVPLFTIPEEGTNYKITKGTEKKLNISATDAFGETAVPTSSIEYSIASDNGADLSSIASFDNTTGEFIFSEEAPLGTYTVDFITGDPNGMNVLKGSIRYIFEVCENAATKPKFSPIGNKTLIAGDTFSIQLDAGKSKYEYSYTIKDNKGNTILSDEIYGSEITLVKQTGLFVWKTDKTLSSKEYYITFTAVSEEGESDTITVKVITKGVPELGISGLENYTYTKDSEYEYTITMKTLKTFEAKFTVSEEAEGYVSIFDVELPEGAVFESTTGRLTWTPSYKQYMEYKEGKKQTLRIGAYNAGSSTPVITLHFVLEAPDESASVFVNNWTPVVSGTQFTNPAGSYMTYNNGPKTSVTLDAGATNSGNLIFGRSLRVAQPVFGDSTITVRIPGDVSTIMNAAVMFCDSTSMLTGNGGNFTENAAMMFLAKEGTLNGGEAALGFAWLKGVSGEIKKIPANQMKILQDENGNNKTTLTGNVYVRLNYKLNSTGTATVSGEYSKDGVNFTSQAGWSYEIPKEVVDKGMYVQLLGVGQDAGNYSYPVTFDNIEYSTGIPMIGAYVDTKVQINATVYHSYKDISYDYILKNPAGQSVEGNYDKGIFTFVPESAGDYTLTAKASVNNSDGEDTIQKDYIIRVEAAQPPVFNSPVTVLNTITGVRITANVSASQINGDGITYSVSVKDGSGNLVTEGNPIVTRSGMFSWTPSETGAGNYSVEVIATANGPAATGLTATQTFNVVVKQATVNFVNEWTPVVSSSGQFKKDASTYVTYNDGAKTSVTLDAGDSNNGNLILGRSIRVAQPIYNDTTITVRVPGDVSTIKNAIVMFCDSNSMITTTSGNSTENAALMYLAKEGTLDGIGFSWLKGNCGELKKNNANQIKPLQDENGNTVTSVNGNVYLQLTYTLNGDGSATVTGAYSTDGYDFTAQTDWTYTLDKSIVDKGMYVQLLGVGQQSGKISYPVTFDSITIDHTYLSLAGKDTPVSITAEAYHPYKRVDYSYQFVSYENTEGIADSSVIETDKSTASYDNGTFTFTPSAAGTYYTKLIANTSDGQSAERLYQIDVSDAGTLVLDLEDEEAVTVATGSAIEVDSNAAENSDESLDKNSDKVQSFGLTNISRTLAQVFKNDVTDDTTISDDETEGIQWSVSNSQVLSLCTDSDKQVTVTGLQSGIAYVYAVYNDKMYSYKVTVVNNDDVYEDNPSDTKEDETEDNESSSRYIQFVKSYDKKTAILDLTVLKEKLKEVLNEATKENPFILEIPLYEEYLLEQLDSSKVNAIHINITVPDSLTNDDTLCIRDLILKKEIIQKAKEKGKTIKITIQNENKVEGLSLNIDGNSLKASSQSICDLNLSVEVIHAKKVQEIKKVLEKDYKNSKGLVVQFTQLGTFPSQTEVKVYVGSQEGIKPGKKVYVYKYNDESGKLDTLTGGYSYKVDKNGYVTLKALSGGKYVVLPNKASSKIITSLLAQIKVAAKYTIQKGKTKTINITLPITLERVNSLSKKTSSTAVGAMTVQFTSSNNKIATVNKTTGKVTAKKKGKTVITAKVTLYSGKVKTYKTTIFVK